MPGRLWLLWVSIHAHMRIPCLSRSIRGSKLIRIGSWCLLGRIRSEVWLRVHPRLLRDRRSIRIVLKLPLLKLSLLLLAFLLVLARFSTARHCSTTVKLSKWFSTVASEFPELKEEQRVCTKRFLCGLLTRSAPGKPALRKTVMRNSDPSSSPKGRAHKRNVLRFRKNAYSNMPKSGLAQELLRVGQRWPTDILRPRLQYGNLLVALSQSKEHQKGLTPELVRSQHRLIENRLKDKVGSISSHSPLSKSIIVRFVREDDGAGLVSRQIRETCQLARERCRVFRSRSSSAQRTLE